MKNDDEHDDDIVFLNALRNHQIIIMHRHHHVHHHKHNHREQWAMNRAVLAMMMQ